MLRKTRPLDQGADFEKKELWTLPWSGEEETLHFCSPASRPRSEEDGLWEREGGFVRPTKRGNKKQASSPLGKEAGN